MEPLTAITMIAMKYGVSAVFNALTGDRSLGDLAAELVTVLAASEDRLGERLAGIEHRLDEVLEQRYKTALDTGLRTLLDAGTTTDPRIRADELVRARDLFREAAASARSTLQVAVAERYLALCTIALGRHDAARTALRRLNGAAFEALLDAAGLAGPQAQMQARAQLEGSGFQFKREDRIAQLATSIVTAATEAGQFSGRILHEAAMLAEGLGHSRLPDLRIVPDGIAHNLDLWAIRPRGPEPVRFGPLTVIWHHVRFREPPNPTTPPETGPRHALNADPPRPAPQRPVLLPPQTRTIDVAVTVRTDPVLSRPVDLTFNELDQVRRFEPIYLEGRPSWQLRAGEQEIRFTHAIISNLASPVCMLNVGGVLLFRSS